MTIIYFILLLTIIICIHEAGHLYAAKKFNVYCYEYSFGMGPILWKKETKETQYSIRAIPVGGYVAMAGEVEGDEAYPGVEVPDDRRLINIAPWKRIIIMLAGVFMNFVLAWVLFSIIALHTGVHYESPKPVVNSVVESLPAELAGIEPGDMILEVESVTGATCKAKTYRDVQMFLMQYGNDPLNVTVDRNGETLNFDITPTVDEETGMHVIGIVGDSPIEKQVTFLNCWHYGFKNMISFTGLMFNVIGDMFKGQGLDNLGGPIAIYGVTKKTVNYGFFSYIYLMAQLSLNIGIFNLIPLPILDGGQVVLTIGEWIAGKPLNEKVRTGIIYVCWGLMLLLMLKVTWNDISKLLMK